MNVPHHSLALLTTGATELRHSRRVPTLEGEVQNELRIQPEVRGGRVGDDPLRPEDPKNAMRGVHIRSRVAKFPPSPWRWWELRDPRADVNTTHRIFGIFWPQWVVTNTPPTDFRLDTQLILHFAFKSGHSAGVP